MIYEFSFWDLTPFVLLYGVGVFLATHKLKTNKSAYYIFIIMLVFSTIRYGIGYDYYAYRDTIINEQPDWKYEMMEPISLLIVQIGKLFDSSELYFFIYAVLTLYPIYYVSKQMSIKPSVSILIYLLYPSFFISSLDIIRNSLAFSWVFLSYYYLSEKKIIIYILCCIFAAQVHTSAYLGFLLYFVRFLPSNKYYYIIMILLSYIMGDYISKLEILHMIPGVSSYMTKLKPVGTMKYLMLVFVIFNYLSWDKLKNSCLDLLKIVSVGLAFFFMFMIDDTLSFRVSTYFVYFIILLIPHQLYVQKLSYVASRNIMIVFLIGIIVFQWYLMISNYNATGNRMSTIPYQTIFYNKDYSNYVY